MRRRYKVAYALGIIIHSRLTFMNQPIEPDEFDRECMSDKEVALLDIDDYVQINCGCVLKVLPGYELDEKRLRIINLGKDCKAKFGGVYNIEDFNKKQISQADGIIAQLEGEL